MRGLMRVLLLSPNDERFGGCTPPDNAALILAVSREITFGGVKNVGENVGFCIFFTLPYNHDLTFIEPPPADLPNNAAYLS